MGERPITIVEEGPQQLWTQASWCVSTEAIDTGMHLHAKRPRSLQRDGEWRKGERGLLSYSSSHAQAT